ncbi:DUF6906 family protein [Bacillus mycoides]|uniref:DUF6906 family protein n=1 Tax=Bacillus mycoides TaxID=1405 RepID=UPI003D24A6AB
MKNGKKPTKKEKIYIKSYHLDPENWLIFKKANNELHLVHRDTNTTKVIPNI